MSALQPRMSFWWHQWHTYHNSGSRHLLQITLSRFTSCSSRSRRTTLTSSCRLWAPGQSLRICHISRWNFSVAMLTPRNKRLCLYRPSGAAKVMSFESGWSSIWWKAMLRCSLLNTFASYNVSSKVETGCLSLRIVRVTFLISKQILISPSGIFTTTRWLISSCWSYWLYQWLSVPTIATIFLSLSATC